MTTCPRCGGAATALFFSVECEAQCGLLPLFRGYVIDRSGRSILKQELVFRSRSEAETYRDAMGQPFEGCPIVLVACRSRFKWIESRQPVAGLYHADRLYDTYPTDVEIEGACWKLPNE